MRQPEDASSSMTDVTSFLKLALVELPGNQNISFYVQTKCITYIKRLSLKLKL